MNETSKATRRRWIEQTEKIIPWDRIFIGKGIDVGCGTDKLPFEDCIGFDQKDGDANDITKYFQPETFDYLHSSQSLEHMIDPAKALKSWIEVVKKGGFLIATVPSWELYEGMRWPSVYNPDHRSTWSMWMKDSPSPIHVLLPKWLKQFTSVNVILCRLVDNNYDYKKGVTLDQTWNEADGVECFLEFVLEKL